MKLDSHQHFWVINDTDYVWMSDAHSPIKRDFLPSDLEALSAVSGIDGCVAVQARQTIEETQWLLDLAEQNNFIRAVVGWIPLLEDDAAPWLDQFAAQPRLAGVRHVVHDESDDNFILRDDFNAGIKQLAAHSLVYDLLIFAKHLPQTVRFVDRHPSQSFVVDHIAKPTIQQDSFDQSWADGIRELAERENVSCKVSGMLTEVRDLAWDINLLQPYFDTILEAFGSQRIMFGSDWPVCLLRTEYSGWVQIAADLAASLSTDEQAAFWGENAARIYAIEPST